MKGKTTSEGKMTAKKIICLATAFLMTFGIAFGSYSANAKETQQSLQNKINNAQNQIDENNSKKSEIEEDMSDLESKIDKAESEVSALESEVAEANSNLQDAANELEEGNKALNDRLRTMYKSGSMGFVDVILSSENVSDLMNNFSIVQYIFKNDKDIVTELKEKHEQLNEMAKTLQAKQSELNEKQQALNADYSELASARKDLQSENEQLEGQVAQWEKASQEIASEINSAINSGGGYQPPSSGGSNVGNPSTQGFIWPCSGYVSREFGSFITGLDDIPHRGMDIGGIGYNAPIKASKAGRVIVATSHWSYGNYVVIDHGNGITTLYAHNTSLAVGVGQYVSQGQVIAYSGSTGNSTGPHCHFEVRVNGSPVNPRNYL